MNLNLYLYVISILGIDGFGEFLSAIRANIFC